MELEKRFQQFISSNRLFSKKDRLLIAVSGGVDSVVLAHLCKQSSCDFAIAHVNFNLRGEESEGDQELVRDLSTQLKVPFYSELLDATSFAGEKKISIQVAARDLRYRYFETIANAEGFDKVLTAHHADDNAETMLMNFLKGTGIDGLRGIPMVRKKICRPLLFATKEDILEYARLKGLHYREDSSNLTDKYTRNVVRMEIFPALEKAYPQFRHNLRENIFRFGEISVIYRNTISSKLKKLVVEENGETKVPVAAVLGSGFAKSLLHEILGPLGFTTAAIHDAEKLLYAESGRYIQSDSHRVLRNRNWLIISTSKQDDQSIILIEKGTTTINFAEGTLNLLTGDGSEISDDANVAIVSSKMVGYPLILRRWKTGDYFYPLGMKHKKKLSRFFIDKKLSLFEKEKVWVLESDKRIVWVVGMRIDDRFRVCAPTEETLRITLVPK